MSEHQSSIDSSLQASVKPEYVPINRAEARLGIPASACKSRAEAQLSAEAPLSPQAQPSAGSENYSEQAELRRTVKPMGAVNASVL